MKKYSKDHVWVTWDKSNRIQIGLTSFAMKRLGEVVNAEWPEKGSPMAGNQPIGIVESAKMVADLYAPADGRVDQINPALKESLAILNQDPEGDGWIVICEIKDPHQLDALMTLEQYLNWINEHP